MANLQVIEEKIKTNVNVDEPINAIHKRIEESAKPVLVLKGERGSGRTTILLTKEAKNQLGKDISIYHRFEYSNFPVTSREVGLDFIKHKFEVEMARMFLKFINSNGIYTIDTELVEREIKRARQLLEYDINYLGVNTDFKSRLVGLGYYTEPLIKQIKESYSPEKFSLLMDRFDWMFNCSREAQNCIQDYFYLFDQVILTTDDENYSSKYPTIEVAYSKEKEVIKEIIRKYVWAQNINKSIVERIDLRSLSEETIDYMIERSNGNIDFILKAIDELYLGEYAEKEFDSALKINLNVQVNEREKIKQMKMAQPKFYI